MRRRITDRNLSITMDVLNGATLSEVGTMYDITRSRVSDIVYQTCYSVRILLDFHFPPGEWETSLAFFREHKEYFIMAFDVWRKETDK